MEVFVPLCDAQEKTAMNISVISYQANTASDSQTERAEMARVGDTTRRLADLGHRVDWITSTDIIDTSIHHPEFVPDSQDSLPPTCRYVLPCRPCRFAGVTLFTVARDVWQNTALQTRLFSFLCLLNGEREWDVMYATGDLAAVFVSVYTARFLGLPVGVSYNEAFIASRGRQPFVWRWINRHVTLASVSCEADRRRLLAVSDLATQSIQVVEAGHLDAERLYAKRRSDRAEVRISKPDDGAS